MKNLKQQTENIRMTPEEKNAMRARIFRVPKPSPYVIFNFQFISRAVAVLLILSLGGGGVAYAAEGSLPGQPLYPVKVNVVEPVQVALAPTTAAKAGVYAQLAQTRVEEAETLASQGDLDATATQELSQNFDTQVTNADALSLQVANTDPAAAADIQTSLSASLEAHSSILSQIGDRDGSTTQKESRAFAAQVLASAQKVGGSVPDASAGAAVAINAGAPSEASGAAKINTFAVAVPAAAPATSSEATSSEILASSTSSTPIATSSSATSTAASVSGHNEIGTRATQALMDAQVSYDSAKSSLDATTTAELDAQFAQAGSLLQSGDYTGALRLAVKLQTLIETQQKLHTNILPLLQFNINIGGNRHGSDDSGGDNSDR
jgi:hypothetical protein